MSPLYQAVLANASLYKQLFILDQDLAETSRRAGCAFCSGALYRAPFRRKPRGVPAGLGEDYCVRCSFCCAVDGCRKRLTPASLRFLGRKVYLAVVATLITAMRCGVTEARLQRLPAELGVDRRTLERWRTWWLSSFSASRFWRSASAAFMPPVDASRLPAALLDRFLGNAEQRVIAFLRWLGPITGGASAMRAF
jgi:hypothetical protein